MCEGRGRGLTGGARGVGSASELCNRDKLVSDTPTVQRGGAEGSLVVGGEGQRAHWLCIDCLLMDFSSSDLLCAMRAQCCPARIALRGASASRLNMRSWMRCR